MNRFCLLLVAGLLVCGDSPSQTRSSDTRLARVDGPREGVSRQIELNDLWSIRSLHHIQITSDGRLVLFAVTSSVASAERDEWKILDTQTALVSEVALDKKYYQNKVGDHLDLKLSKAGDGLFFTQREGERLSLWSWSLVTRDAKLLFLAGEGAEDSFEESPDGRYTAYLREVPDHVQADKLRNTAMQKGGFVLDQSVNETAAVNKEIWIWDRKSEKQRLAWAGGAVDYLVWSPDSSKFLAVHYSRPERVTLLSLQSVGIEGAGGLVILNTENDKIQKLRNTAVQADSFLGWAPDGKAFAIDSPTIDETQCSAAGLVGWYTRREPEEWRLDEHTQEFVKAQGPLFTETKSRRRRFRDDWFDWHQDGKIYYGHQGPHYTIAIAAAKLGESGKSLSAPKWNLSNVVFAERADLAAGVRQSVDDPPELALIDLHSGEVRTVTHYNAAIAKLSHPPVEAYDVTNKFGYKTENWLIKPANYEPGKSYPLIMLVYYNWENAFHALPRMKTYAPFEYAKLGAFVLLAAAPTYDGAIGPGRQSLPERWRFGLGPNALASYESAVDQLVGAGLVDPSRVAISGFSFGGFLAQYSITHSKRFSAAIIDDGGWWNPFTYYYSGYEAYYAVAAYDAVFGGPPLGDGLQTIKDFSPAFRFGHLPIPVLIEGHNGDFSIKIFSDVYLTARQEGTPIELVIYDDSHEMKDRSRQFSSISRSIDWFRYWLLDEKNPNPVDKDEYARWAGLRKKLEVLKQSSAQTQK
jgi:dipeptidyl aminopeptidase/acylaminoacyl peptidase